MVERVRAWWVSARAAQRVSLGTLLMNRVAPSRKMGKGAQAPRRRGCGGGAEYAAMGAGVERGRNEEGAQLHLRCGWVMQVSGVEAGAAI